ncbi:hypothetical protein N878_08785 [Pseudomonas sp. EGD-AK9]|uniref:ankyrin repeat domain-containing protein n=1 Tax=Pseudomonas sp. EGD-AK9 TaxID=1386078 RepID=UPI0003968942|nr:ankyrin repeat domain-containing protein [Pseudomonas sp. EGD-AK9]ERI50429.1 hypothetical protein N878_08785 [Pseudomonas sp. EGD-AK9]
MQAVLPQIIGLLACVLMVGPVGATPEAEQRLRAAAAVGDLPGLDALLAQGVVIDAQDEQGNSALLLATAGNRIEVARVLVEAGADVNLQNARQDSAYLLAGASGYLQILELTLAHGADLRSTNRFGGTALIPACERGHVETVRRLIAAGVDVDHVNHLGWTCLLEAVILGDGGPAHQRIVALLIEAGADLQLADRDGVSALRHAERRGQTRVAELLINAGAH